jgi:hypothetical protein
MKASSQISAIKGGGRDSATKPSYRIRAHFNQFLHNELIFRTYSPIINYFLKLSKKTFTARGYNSSTWHPLLGQTSTPRSSSSEPAPGAAQQPCIWLDEATKTSPFLILTNSPPRSQPEMTSTKLSNKVPSSSLPSSHLKTNILRLI